MFLVEYILTKAGIVCSREKTVRIIDNKMSIHDAIWSSYLQPVFNIDTSILTDMFAMSFKKCNPYTQALLEYRKCPNTQYEDSKLYKYYADFQPSSLEEVFFSKKNTAVEKKSGLFTYQLPWDSKPKTNNGKKMNYSGPMDVSRGRKEYERLIDVYRSIMKRGYKSYKSANLFDSNNIQGYFLKWNDEYRFVVLHGKHRAASLLAAGAIKVPVTFDLKHPRVIDRDTVAYWPLVEKKVMKRESALMVFDAFFAINNDAD